MVFCILLQILTPLNLPENILDWVRADFKSYNKKNIFDYIDGAGEIYISYNFKNLKVYNYKKGEKEILLDVFEMEEPKFAYGLFTHLRGNGEEVLSLGEDAEIFGGWLIFWKGKYFVSLNSEEGRQNIINFGKEIEKCIEKKGKNFEILKYAEKLKLDKKSFKYFFNMSILNYNYYIINEDIFFFEKGTEGIFSPLKEGYVLLLLFKNKLNAKKGLENLKKKFYGGDYEVIEIEKDKWSSFILKENLLLVFLDFPTKENLSRIINEIR